MRDWFRYFVKENSYFFKVEREERLISVLCEGEFIFLQGRERLVTDFGTLWRRILIFFKKRERSDWFRYFVKENSYFFKVEREERLISVLCEGEFLFFKREREERLILVLCEGEFIFFKREREERLISVLCEGEFLFFKREREERLILVLC